MKESLTFFLTIVTENQSQTTEAEKLSELIKSELGGDWKVAGIDKYSKFDLSFKIELEAIVSDSSQERVNHLAICLTDKVVSPWLVYFDEFERSIELIFNKGNGTRNRRSEFEAIKWAHFQITKR